MPQRRTFLAGAAAALIAPSAGFALSPQSAQALVDQLAVDITKTINSGKSGTALYRDFERIFKRYADVPTIARYALGPAARGAGSSDLKAYTDAFSGYISRKYGRRFKEFVGGSIEVQRARTDRQFVVVESVAKLRGQSPIKVDFLVSDRSGRDAFFNVIIEGINMLTTERTEIGALLDQAGGSLPRLTATLKSV